MLPLEMPAFNLIYTILSFDIIVVFGTLSKLSLFISNKTDALALFPSYIYIGTVRNGIL